jgi:hypothetical protein
MRTKSCIIIQNWNDPRVIDIRDDCMLPLSAGVYFHHRLASVIIVKSEMIDYLAAVLPE